MSKNTDRHIKNSLVVYEDSPAGTLLSTLDVIEGTSGNRRRAVSR
jgi:hypothetical protein